MRGRMAEEEGDRCRRRPCFSSGCFQQQLLNLCFSWPDGRPYKLFGESPVALPLLVASECLPSPLSCSLYQVFALHG